MTGIAKTSKARALGDALKEERMRASLTQRELASRIERDQLVADGAAAAEALGLAVHAIRLLAD